MSSLEATAGRQRDPPAPVDIDAADVLRLPAPSQRTRLGLAGALVRATRPRQWMKNLLILAAPGAAGVLDHGPVAVRVAMTLVAFCLLSASTYLFNDLRDLEQDRLHPRKRFRPLAAGELSPRVAGVAGVATALGGIGLATAARPLAGGAAVLYLAVTAGYTLRGRDVPVLDALAIAAGFVVRALAGAAAAPVVVTLSFLLVTAGVAVFIVAGKRYAELRTLAGRPGATRPVLGTYTLTGLRRGLLLSAAVACGAYVRWAALRHEHGALPYNELSTVLFAACLVRYGRLLVLGRGQAPEELVLSDRLLAVLVLGWVGLFALGVHAGD